MIDFEEELKKFHKSPEIGDTEDVAIAQDLTDAVDVLLSLTGGFEDEA